MLDRCNDRVRVPLDVMVIIYANVQKERAMRDTTRIKNEIDSIYARHWRFPLFLLYLTFASVTSPVLGFLFCPIAASTRR